MALLTVDQWANSVNGKYIDHDGFPAGNIYQCHDLWIDYLMRVAGGSQAMGYAPSGLTDSVFTSFPYGGLDSKVTKYFGSSGIRKGDVVFWASGSANYPSSHVAIALAPPSGGSVLCMSQNPGSTKKLNLTLAGALGYLRPKNITAPITPTPREKNNEMLMIHKPATSTDPTQYAVFGPNFWLEFAGQTAANGFAAQVGANSVEASTHFWDHCKAASGK